MDDQFKKIKSKVKTPKKIQISNKTKDTDNDIISVNLDDYNDRDFKTPEEMAALDLASSAEPILDRKEFNMPKKKRIHWSALRSKRGITIITLLLLIAVGVTAFIILSPNHKKSIISINTHKVVSSTVPSTLTGLQVNPATNQLPITGVMIENSLDARPQSGLSNAGVVFEAVAEGGITRFLALFQNNDNVSVGPIRSARPYYVSWAMGFDAAYVHVGGSPDALSDISSWNVKDLDQFYNASYFQRISSRPAPHNVYSTLSQLTQLEQSKNYTSSKFTSWQRKSEQPSKTPTANKISFSLSGPMYDPVYTYDTKTNSYDRDENGVPQIDANTNKQLSPKVIIGIVLPLSQGELDASGAYYSDYNFIGSGNAYIFQDGKEIKGTWTKNSNADQIIFKDANGNIAPLNPGQTWITAIASDSSLSVN